MFEVQITFKFTKKILSKQQRDICTNNTDTNRLFVFSNLNGDYCFLMGIIYLGGSEFKSSVVFFNYNFSLWSLIQCLLPCQSWFPGGTIDLYTVDLVIIYLRMRSLDNMWSIYNIAGTRMSMFNALKLFCWFLEMVFRVWKMCSFSDLQKISFLLGQEPNGSKIHIVLHLRHWKAA